MKTQTDKTQTTEATEATTIKAIGALYTLVDSIEQSDKASIEAAQHSEIAITALKAVRAQYTKLQDGRNKNKKPAVGELPYSVALGVIDKLYDAHSRKVQRASFQDRWVKIIKQVIATGELKAKTVKLYGDDLIAQYEKELQAAQAQAKKALDDAKAAKEKAAQAQAQEAQVKEQAAQTVANAVKTGDAENVTESILDTTRQVKQAAQTVAQASKTATQADKTATQAQAQVTKAQTNLVNAKAKANQSAGKADNNQQSEPTLNLAFIETNASQECRDRAAVLFQLLDTIVLSDEHINVLKDGKFSAPELLMLAKLILDKYNK